ncbi:MAG: hypothetical protein DME91_05900 [Verrucomicrobia bacterium]|nr:MAG: hypothetical protein DME91_05900 [Verrucomicrobiota bacterium]
MALKKIGISMSRSLRNRRARNTDGALRLSRGIEENVFPDLASAQRLIVIANDCDGVLRRYSSDRMNRIHRIFF